MFRSHLLRRELLSGINVGRRRLAEQFSTMENWQATQDPRFDQFVQARREKAFFDEFDQRVERAYASAAAIHKKEVLNAIKRRLKEGGGRFTAEVMREAKSAVEERLRWLREVWSQVDADYRSGDATRQEVAAKEISAALHGEPGEYMRWVYETKRDQRFLGPKEKAAQAAELETAELPDVSDEEVNRYHSLRLNMAEVERNVKNKYGVAGQQHWAELQRAKDDLYEQKLDDAAKVYEQLLDQSARYDESRRTALLRSHVGRVHTAQVRFRAAMELEKARERLVDAHAAMNKERADLAKEERRARLKEAAELRASGATSDEVATRLHQHALEQHARRQAEYQLQEREAVSQRKTQLLGLINEFKADVEAREGRALLSQPKKADPAARNVFGFADDDRLDSSGDGIPSATPPAEYVDAASPTAAAHTSATGEAPTATSSAKSLEEASAASRAALRQNIAADVYEDPFRTVHQARLDAAKTYDPLYASHFPLSLVQGRKYSRQGMGEHAVGNGMDRQILQGGNKVWMNYQWGVHPPTVHDLDGDGNTDYFLDNAWHVRDKTTGDIDWRYEKKKGGPVFKGPRFYRMGAERDRADPGEQTMDPAPFMAGGLQRQHRGGAGGMQEDWRSS